MDKSILAIMIFVFGFCIGVVLIAMPTDINDGECYDQRKNVIQDLTCDVEDTTYKDSGILIIGMGGIIAIGIIFLDLYKIEKLLEGRTK